MIPNNYQQLIQSLSTKTQKGEALWTRISDRKFKLVLHKSTIIIDKWETDYNNWFISIDIYNLDGDIIDRYISAKEPENQADVFDYYRLEEFHRIISNAIDKKTNDAIQVILNEIETEGSVGKIK